jgi:ABC-type branched-subunit amino acid transport system permease subunit
MYVGFAFFELRRTGDLVLPVIGLPDRIPITAVTTDPETGAIHNVPTLTFALFVALALAAVVGLVVYLLVFRPLRHAPSLAKVVASLGLLLYLLALAGLRFSGSGAATGIGTEPLLPTEPVTLLGVTIPQDRLWLGGLTFLVTAALWAYYRFTRTGLETRAAAENEKGAVILGLSPDRLGAVNWMLGCVLAGGAVILVAGARVVRLAPSEIAFLIVPALAAALMGRFEAVVVTAAAGVAIGVTQSGLVRVQSEWDWLPDVGLQQGLPFLLILITMAVRGQTFPERGTLTESRFPRSARPVAVVPVTVGLALVAVVGLWTLDSDWRLALITSTIAALAALSVVVVTGYVGQLSLAPMAFAGIAAFTMVKLSADHSVPFPIAPVAAALVATAVGLVAGLPAVRVRGMNLAVATLAAAVAIEELVFKWGWFTGGLGGTSVPEPSLFGIDLGISAAGDAYPRPAFGTLCVIVLAVAAVAVANLRRSATGLRWLAVRTNENAASAAGVNVARAKLLAFAVSSFLAGLAGTLLAYARQTLSLDSFRVFESLALIAVTYIGGVAGVAGALVAGAISQGGLLTVALGGDETSQYQFAVNGVALIAIAIAYPDGLTAALVRLSRLRRGFRSSAGRSGASAKPAAPEAAQS